MTTAHARRAGVAMVALLAAAMLGGCIGETYKRGYILSETALEQVPVGASRDQVLVALGTPSTTADFGGEVFYYISQTAHRQAAFMSQRVVDQRVLAIYLDGDEQVERIANYGLQDGRVFDFVTRTTPTGGKDFSFLTQIFAAAGRVSPGGAGPRGPGPGMP